jgi:hypothetical protein
MFYKSYSNGIYLASLQDVTYIYDRKGTITTTQEPTVLRKIALRKIILLLLNFRRIRDGTIEIYIVLNGNYDTEAGQFMEL